MPSHHAVNLLQVVTVKNAAFPRSRFASRMQGGTLKWSANASYDIYIHHTLSATAFLPAIDTQHKRLPRLLSTPTRNQTKQASPNPLITASSHHHPTFASETMSLNPRPANSTLLMGPSGDIETSVARTS